MTHRQLRLGEFVSLVAVLFALIALGTDAVLPAIEEIAADYGLSSTNHAQIVILAFVLGTGLGQLVAGPLSDAIGRRPVILGGILLFVFSSIISVYSPNFETEIIARIIQGFGISAPRSAGNAMVRDLYVGRKMARVMSLAMMLFMVAPAAAPYLGQVVMNAYGWRHIYTALLLIALFSFIWFALRQAETLEEENKRPFNFQSLFSGAKMILSHRRVYTTIAVLSLVYSALFAYLTTAQQAFVTWLGTGEDFPFYFALVAIFSASSNAINAMIVERVGMWKISTIALATIGLWTLIVAILFSTQAIPETYHLTVFLLWSVSLFFLLSMCFGNLNALALEPMGKVAGFASALIGAIATTISVFIALPLGQLFNGTAIPLMFGVGIMSLAAFAINLTNPRVAD